MTIKSVRHSTYLFEGVCWAVCEELLRGHAYTFLATHFELIPKLAALYPTVTNYHFQMENQTEGQQDGSFAHKLGKFYYSFIISEKCLF